MSNHNNSQTNQPLGLRLYHLQIALLPIVIVGIIFAGYKGIHWSELLSFRVDDGWCRTGIEGIGRHCFGDFGLPYNRGNFQNVYEPGNMDATSTPLTAVIFEFFRLFPYDIALVIYQSWMILSVFLPIFLVSTSYSLAVRIGASTIIGVGSIGAISAIDRGNHVAVLVPLGLAYIISLEKKRWSQALLFLVILSMLKFWGIVLVIGLIANRRYRDSAYAILITALGSLGLLFFFPGGFSLKFSSMYDIVTDKNYAADVAGYATSTHGLVKRVACAFSTTDWCNTEVHARSIFSSSFFSLLIVLFLVGWCWWLLRIAKAPVEIWGASILALAFMAVPDAPTYNTVFAVAIAALLFWSSNQLGTSDEKNRGARKWHRSSTTLVWIIALTQLPMTIFIAYTGVGDSKSVLASGTSDVPPFFRLNYWTTPTLWILFVIITLWDGGQKAGSEVGEVVYE